ncbi:MAG: hypothetical protein WCK89_12830 [bacterium]
MCLICAFVGFSIVVIAEMIAQKNSELRNSVFNSFAGVLTLVALVTGIYAQTAQLRHWNPTVKRRLLIGLPVALLNALMVISSFLNKYESVDSPSPVKLTPPAVADTLPEDNALVKPGWYGELQQDKLLLVVSSFEDNAAEARLFCRRLFKPISYATLSLINLGTAVPVVLQSLQVSLHLDSGEEVPSLAVRPLLEKKAGVNAGLLQRLTVPLALSAGAMLPDIPICQETNFPWAHVTAVSVSLSSRTLTIPGRMMTVSEKQAMLDHAAETRPPGGTNMTADTWFNNL